MLPILYDNVGFNFQRDFGDVDNISRCYTQYRMIQGSVLRSYAVVHGRETEYPVPSLVDVEVVFAGVLFCTWSIKE